MGLSSGLFHPGDLLAFAAGAGAAAALGFLRRHEVYIHMVAKLPLTFALDYWIRTHLLRHPIDAAWRIVIGASLPASVDTSEVPHAPRG